MNLPPNWNQVLIRLSEALIAFVILGAAFVWWQWYQDDGGFEAVYVAVGVLLAGLVATRRWLKQQSTNTDQRQAISWTQPLTLDSSLPALRRQIEQTHNLAELHTLTFDLNLTYDNLAGQTLTEKVISLLETCRKQGRLPNLITHLQEARPNIQWVQPNLQAPIPTIQADNWDLGNWNGHSPYGILIRRNSSLKFQKTTKVTKLQWPSKKPNFTAPSGNPATNCAAVWMPPNIKITS